MRYTAYISIKSGALLPLTPKSAFNLCSQLGTLLELTFEPAATVTLLALSSKVAKAFLDITDLSNCESVLSEGAEYCEMIRESTMTPVETAAEGLVLHYSLRMKHSSLTGNRVVASYVKSQADQIAGKLGEKVRPLSTSSHLLQRLIS